jgi:hypothetical protein
MADPVGVKGSVGHPDALESDPGPVSGQLEGDRRKQMAFASSRIGFCGWRQIGLARCWLLPMLAGAVAPEAWLF